MKEYVMHKPEFTIIFFLVASLTALAVAAMIDGQDGVEALLEYINIRFVV